MTPEYFDEAVVPLAIQRSKEVLAVKSKEYSGRRDRLDNFKTSAKESGTDNPIEELVGMAKKHWISLVQMSRDPEAYSRETWLEKTTDLRNYTILLEGLLIDEEI
jgi:hypothetical protein